jgi:hypothetical protein
LSSFNNLNWREMLWRILLSNLAKSAGVWRDWKPASRSSPIHSPLVGNKRKHHSTPLCPSSCLEPQIQTMEDGAEWPAAVARQCIPRSKRGRMQLECLAATARAFIPNPREWGGRQNDPQIEGEVRQAEISGYDEDSGVIVLHVDTSSYTLQLMSVQSRKLCGTNQVKFLFSFHKFLHTRWLLILRP